MDEPLIILISAAIGGAGTKVIEAIFNRKNKKLQAEIDGQKLDKNEAAQIRHELREEVLRLREDMVELREEVDTWKQRYYKLLEEHNELKVNHLSLQNEVEEMKSKQN